jgi:hypothetical protein
MATAAEPETDYPADEEFETDVLPVRRRPRLPIVTTLLVLAAMAAAAFAGGVEIQKHYGASSSSSSTSAASSAAGPRGGAGFAGFGARGAAGGGAPGGFGGGAPAGGAGGTPTAGLVTLIKGSTLYVTDFSGNTIKVSTPKGLRVSKTVTSSVKNIHPGDSVVVVATKTKGGYVARSVTVNNANG